MTKTTKTTTMMNEQEIRDFGYNSDPNDPCPFLEDSLEEFLYLQGRFIRMKNDKDSPKKKESDKS